MVQLGLESKQPGPRVWALSYCSLFLGMFAYIRKMSSQDFHFISFNLREHVTVFPSGYSSSFPECSMYSCLCSRYWLCLESPFSSSPPRKLLFILQSPVQCHLFSEACPTPILDRMIYSLPSDPIAGCLHYTIF